MERADLIFLHIPARVNGYRLAHRFMGIQFLPMELLGLADLLQRQGVATQIIHAGIEEIEDPHFSILDYLRQKNPQLVALDLHWHHQSFEVMEWARQIKETLPHTYILLGGSTASFFHEEIMNHFDSVDGIIRGEVEVPLLELANTVLRKKEVPFSVPNLTWRRKGRIFINPFSYVASEKDLDGLSFTSFPLLKNYPAYLRHMGQPFHVKRISKEKPTGPDLLKPPLFHLPVGRGCPVQCTWCSAGMVSQQTISGRQGVTFRGEEAVLKTIREALSYGFKTLYICFDPYPQKPEYYLRLFSRIRDENLKMECFFESFGLPTTDFVKSFKETFPSPDSLISLSPDVGSGRVRKMHKGYAFSNRALMANLDQMKAHQVYCALSFTLGVPFETEEDLQQTRAFQKEILRQYPNVKGIRALTLGMEPGSPLHLEPETYGLETSLKGFMDFYHFHSGAEHAVNTLGYWIPNCFSKVHNAKEFEETLRKIQMRHYGSSDAHVGKPPPPSWGGKLSGLSDLVGKMKGWAGKKD
jgi:radical SAM superfamily enzyme YgiQ (UPF0313 family)